MDNLLRKVESDDIVIYKDQVFSQEILEKCREIHQALVSEKKLEGSFNDEKWIGNSDLRKFGIDFSIDEALYSQHIGKEFGISFTVMQTMLRCYVIYCHGLMIYNTLAKIRLKAIKDFLQEYKDPKYKVKHSELTTIEDFLCFIGTPDKQIETVLSNIRLVKESVSEQRKLSPIINYLVIENEINTLYRNGLDDSTFIKWFPIYIWVNITFILPLRATEMLVTPFNCLNRQGDDIYLKIRRTKLKGPGFKTVYYDVEKDYKVCTYKIPDMDVAKNIEKYIELTKSQKRRFLFMYDECSINNMFSLQAFNRLIEAFMTENIIGNHHYDFAKYATGIDEFEIITAGDSRPIAMANLYFQKSGEDICRQLADHINIDTSAHYYTNISETIWASSIVQLQKRLDNEWRKSNATYEAETSMAISTDRSVCMSPKRLRDEENLDDCIAEGHLSDCMGCKYYQPSEKELETFLENQKKKADDSSKRVIDFMNKTIKAKNQEQTLEDVFLSVQTEATRYRMGCNIKAKEKYSEWQEHHNTPKISF